jgi:hypothetical protein
MVGPDDIGNDYARELERKQLEEAYQRQGRTRTPSKLWVTRRLGIDARLFLPNLRLSIGQKLLLLGFCVHIGDNSCVCSSLAHPTPSP